MLFINLRIWEARSRTNHWWHSQKLKKKKLKLMKTHSSLIINPMIANNTISSNTTHNNNCSCNRDQTVKIRIPIRTTTLQANTSNQIWATLNRIIANLSSSVAAAREFKALSTLPAPPTNMWDNSRQCSLARQIFKSLMLWTKQTTTQEHKGPLTVIKWTAFKTALKGTKDKGDKPFKHMVMARCLSMIEWCKEWIDPLQDILLTIEDL